MTRKFSLFLSVLVAIGIVPVAASAEGEAASLKCTAVGDAFKLVGKIPTAEAGLDLIFSDRHGRTRFQSEAGYAADVKEELAEGRFEFDITGQMELTLASVSRTVRANVGDAKTTASFDAILTGAPKTNNPASKHPKLRMRCEYNYPG